ncbi:MAG: 50S ribosomal protein L11 methyltransferase [Pseudomonadota bacterium]
MSWIEYQRSILADGVRNELFERALATVIVKNETTVADIGSGTGFLSFLASRLGAKEVLAVEHNPQLMALAQRLAQKNRIRRVVWLECNSADLVDIPPCDLVVSETLGNYALEENILEILRDAKRFLAPGGTLMPRTIEQFVSPVVEPSYHAELASWDRVGSGLDYGPARALGFNNLYVRRFRAGDLLVQTDADAACWDRVNLLGKYGSLRRGTATFTVRQPVRIAGFANWWRAELVPGVWLSTSPFAPPTHWEQIYFPVPELLSLQAGDSVAIAIVSDSRDGNGCLLKWTVTHARGTKILAKHTGDLRKGA